MNNYENGEYLKNIFLKVAEKDDSSDNLVGIRITKNANREKLTVIFPIGYRLDGISTDNGEFKYDKSLHLQDVKTLIKCLSMKVQGSDEEDSNFSFISAIQVMQDFQTNGLYREDNIEESLNDSGKIDWKKTINNNDNMLFWQKMNFLPNIFYKKTNYNYQGKIQQIQKYCLGLISYTIGAFYNFTYQKYEKPFSNNEMIMILEKKISKTNSDTKKNSLLHLKEFIKDTNCLNINSIKNDVMEFGTKKFHSIWEKIVDKKFGGISDLKKFNPKAYYLKPDFTLDDYTVPVSRPDTIIDRYVSDKNLLVILDAKYYKISRRPMEYDINKQIRYAKYCKKQIKNKDLKISNIFILPKDLENKKCEFVAYATNDDSYKGQIKDGTEVVLLYYVDTKKLLENQTEYWIKILEDEIMK